MSKLKDLSQKAWDATSWADKTIAGVQGLSGIAGAFGDASRMKDTSNYQNEIDSLANTQFDYGDYDSLMGAYNPVSIDRLHVDDLRASDGERAIGTLKGIGSGAMAGAQIAGPIGAIVGGAAGLLSGGIGMIVGNQKAAAEARRLNQEAEDAKNRYIANFANNAQNISQNKFNAAALNLAAFGGFLKDRNMDNFTKSKVRLAAFGGDLTTTIEEPNGFSNGVIKVDEGKTHEVNPFGGVLMGVDPNGTPNLVEQGEVIYNDYVFSNRLYPTGGQLESVKLPKRYEGKSYADIAFDIQRESEIRPLDSISRNSLIDSMAKLTTIQEESRQRDLEYQAFDELENAFADGGSIHIKPSKRGTFTAAAKKHDMGVQEFASKVLANKDKYSPAMVRKANFAHNSTGWKHAFGGKIGNALTGDGDIQNDKTQIDNTRVSLVAPSFTPMWEAPSKKALFNSGLFLDDNGVYYYGPYLETRYVSNDFAKNRVEEDMRRFMRYREDDVLNGKQIYESKSRRSYPKSYTSKPVFAFGGPMGNVFEGKGKNTQYLYTPEEPKDINWANAFGNPTGNPFDVDMSKYSVSPEQENVWDINTVLPFTPTSTPGINIKNDDYIPDEKLVIDDKPLKFGNNEIKPKLNVNRIIPDPQQKPWITAMRAIPVMGSSLQAMSDALGWTNEEDYENPTLIRKAADRIRNVKTSPIGRYMTYNPYDVDYEMNRIQNVGLGTQRGILDMSGGNALAARNAMLALNDRNTSQMGDARRSASQVNEQRRQAVQQFNSNIDQFNAQQALNAGIYNQRADEAKLDAAVREAMLRDNIQSTLSGARSTNYTAALNNAGQFGNDRMFADMAAWYQKYVAPFNRATQAYGASTAAKGGKIKKVKGFKVK